MVRMSQDWKVRLPLIDMHGNNGSIDDDPAAAMRYTEVRLAKVTQVMEDDLDKDTVEMAPNFDDTENEPTVLPVPFPVMLVNGATGIAAGYATNMPPHNMKEVIDATIYRIQNPTCSLDEVMQLIPGPDFPTGAIVQGKQGIVDAFTTGKGRIVVRAKTEVVDAKTCKQILVTEIPYEVIKSELVKQMDEIRISKEIDGILDVRDESDRNGLRIVIDVRKDANIDLILNYFYKNTDLQIYYNYNNVAIIDQRPVQVGLLGLLDAFIEFRKDVVLRRSRYELKRMEDRCHIIEGLMKAVSILDEIIAEIRASKDKSDAKKRISQLFGFDEIQAEAIVSLRLYRLSNTDIMDLREEFAHLVNQIEETKAIIENEKILKSVISKELRTVKEAYGDDRKTKIEDQVSEIVIDRTSMIQSEKVVVTVSRDGYVKRVSMRSFTASEGTVTGKKEGDELIGSIPCDTLDTLLLFTSKGNYAYLPVWQIEEAKWKDNGMHLNKVIRIDGDDKIQNVILVNNFDTYAWIITIASNGLIKKTPVKDWMLQRNSRVTTAMNIAPNAELSAAFVCYEGQDVVLVSKDGYAAKYALTDIPSTGVKSKGVKGLNLAKGDILTSGCAVNKDTTALFFMTKSGNMKRVKLSDIQEGNRPVKGSLIAKKVKSNPQEIIYVNVISSYDVLHFFNGKEDVELKASDIPLKATDSLFASPLELKGEWYKQKEIEECRIMDKPLVEANDEKVHEDIERISLFDEEN